MRAFAGRVVHADKDLDRWRGQVFTAARNAWGFAPDGEIAPPMVGPLMIDLTFYLVIPTRKRKSRAGLPGLFWADTSGMMDLDKLIRGAMDALTWAKVYTDDGLICEITARKFYADPPAIPPGVQIWLKAIQCPT